MIWKNYDVNDKKKYTKIREFEMINMNSISCSLKLENPFVNDPDVPGFGKSWCPEHHRLTGRSEHRILLGKSFISSFEQRKLALSE
jgi:hypothetical protein